MPFKIVRNDITNMRVDAIVNPGNREPVIGYGVDLGIYQKAGPALLEARRAVGRIEPGEAALTEGFSLPARYVIHTVGTSWQGGDRGETNLLGSCYRKTLALAAEAGCESIAFPLMGAGNLGFPREIAMQIAVRACSEFLMTHDMDISLVVFHREVVQLSEKLFHRVKSYIDECYVRETLEEESCPGDFAPYMRWEQRCFSVPERMPAEMSQPVEDDWETLKSLRELLLQKDAGFAQNLVERIEASGRKNSEVYKKANVDKKLFSKIINNVNYHPSKQTALAFAIALELDLPQTLDLIGRAGFTLTHSSKFDIIIEYFIKNRSYDIFEINEVLFRFDQSLLGA